MKTTAVRPDGLVGVFAVPPLARRRDARRTLELSENDRLLRHIVDGGVTRLLYGGNAFLYHITLAEYEELLGWMSGAAGDVWMIPSVGPSFGRAMDQAAIVRRHGFPTAMLLPCSDPRDAAGLERGVREIADALGTPVILYVKEEHTLGTDALAGLDVLGRLARDGLVCAIKYAIVRGDPEVDPYLDELLRRVDRALIVSGMGERPAVSHLRGRRLPGFTTGSGCVAPALSAGILAAAQAGDWTTAEALRRQFLPLEDLRDEWGPARVLHASVEAAGLARVGPIPPFVSELSGDQRASVATVATALADAARSVSRA